jgi:hypothetical protein
MQWACAKIGRFSQLGCGAVSGRENEQSKARGLRRHRWSQQRSHSSEATAQTPELTASLSGFVLEFKGVQKQSLDLHLEKRGEFVRERQGRIIFVRLNGVYRLTRHIHELCQLALAQATCGSLLA